MRVFSALGLLAAVSLMTGGCVTGQGGDAPSAAVPPVPPPVSYGTFLGGAVGLKLAPDDRDKALAAEQDALASGQRRTWKGSSGVYGYVEPAPNPPGAPAVVADGIPPASSETCRAFTSTIYIGGRPQVGHGSGCQTPDGTYRIAS